MSGPAGESLLSRLQSATVRDATGRGWEEWLELLDAAGARGLSHREIVAYLEREHPDVTSWWRQSLSVGYEQARGKRVVGQAAGGFQIGVRRTVDATVQEAWDVLASRPDIWMASGARMSLRPGESYRVAADDFSPAAGGEVRVVKPGDRLRLTWHPEGWAAPATLQLTLMPASAGRTTIGAHLERLPHAQAREAMRERWRVILERLEAALAEQPADARAGS